MEQLIEEEEKQRFEEMDMAYDEAKHEAVDAEAKYLAAKTVVDDFKKRMEEARQVILGKHSQGIEFDLITVGKSTKKGSVDMKALMADLNLMDSDVDKYRKPSSDVYTIRTKKSN